MRLRGEDVVTHAFVGRQRDAIAYRRMPIMQFAFERIGGARNDRTTVEPEHEKLRLLGAQNQSFPELIARERFGERIQWIVDLDEVFEIQVLFLQRSDASAGRSMPRPV